MKQIQSEARNIDVSLFTLGIGFLLAIALIIFAVAVINYQNKQTFDDFISQMNLSHKKIDLAYKLNRAAYRRGYYQYQMILTKDPFDRDELFLEYNKTSYDVLTTRNAISELITDLDEKDLLEAQKDIIKNVIGVQQQIIDALYQGDLETAAELRTKAFQTGYFSKFINNVDNLVELQKARLNSEFNLSTKKYENTQQFSMMILLAIIFIIFLLGSYVLFRIRKEATKIKNTLYLLDKTNAQHRHDSLHDSLTGLPNRSNFFKSATKEIENAGEYSNHNLYILFFDLDGFKRVNDNYGHETGDYILKKLSDRLVNEFKDSVIIARMGGDEFVGLTKVTENEIGDIAKKIIDLACQPFYYNENEIIIGSSVGISQLGKDGDDADLLVRLADVAMYVAKTEQGNSFRMASQLDEKILNKMLPNMSSGRSRK